MSKMYFANNGIKPLTVYQLLLDALWINNPQRTFESENRLNQLVPAQRLRFSIPETLITNQKWRQCKRFFKRFPKSTIVKVLHHHEIYLYSKII